ncbi:MAG TPA: FAD/NAD(P)-binding oxidoreductase [Limnochordales bacterium]|nr:FAD/NAD(P)-binding oxidoreductase [Limnochordales bacterium]
MQDIVVVGGGVGGTVTANLLAEELAAELAAGQVRLRLITDQPDHVYKPAFLYRAFGRTSPPAYRRPQRELLHPAVELIVDPVRRVEVDPRRVAVESDRTFPYDYLVLAAGSRVVPERTPGLGEAGEQFYTEEGASRLYRRLEQFAAGTIVVSVIGVPHMCPVAPLEMAFMLDAFFRERGRRDQVEIVYTYPINRCHSNPAIAQWAAPELEARHIRVETFFNVERIDPARKVIETMEGTELPFDLLIGIPEHAAPAFLEASGLTKDGWVPTDRHTLEVKGQEGMWAVGDVTDLPVSKAGSVAHYQAATVAANLAARVRGLPPVARYNGKTFCFIETGSDAGTYVEFDYDHPPKPVRASRWIHWAKLAYNQTYWLTARGVV